MTSLNLKTKFNTSKVTNMQNMFASCGYTAMTSLNLGSKFNTSNVTAMDSMFYECGYTAMTSLKLGSKFNTSNVTSMNYMFYGCGYTAMTSLDLGPAFTNIPTISGDFVTNCGKSGAVIYAPESIYRDTNTFKLSSNEGSGFDISYNQGTINLKYKPEWTKTSTSVDENNKKVTITLKGATNTDIYTSKVTSSLTNSNITVYIDGEKATGITVTVGTATQSGNNVTQTVTLSNFEKSGIPSGKSFKEWSGNIRLDIATGTLEDSYGNKNLLTTIKESSNISSNTDGSMFADFIAPVVVYRTSNTTVNKNGNQVTLVFDVTDKYYGSGSLSVTDLIIKFDGEEPDWNKVTRTLSSSELTATVNGTSKTIGRRYTLTLTGIAQNEITEGDNYLDYSGILTVAIPAGKFSDESGNANLLTTITKGIDLPEGTGSAEVVDIVNPIWEIDKEGTSVNVLAGSATIKVKGTDKYFSSANLTTNTVKVYVDGSTTPATGITVAVGTVDPLYEERVVGDTTTQVQYGVETTITVNGFSITANQVKIVIEEGALTDESGNTNEATSIMVLNCLKSTQSEQLKDDAFLGNPYGIAREDVFTVVFLSNFDGFQSDKAWDVSAVGDGSIMAWYDQPPENYGDAVSKRIYIGSNYDIYANTNASYLFAYIGFGTDCNNADTFKNLNLLHTANVTNMNSMFYFAGYRGMTELDLGDNFDTSNVTDMSRMFEGCGYNNMTSFRFGDAFNTSKVTDMSWMFANWGYTKMTSLDLSQFDTSKVTNMSFMFADCGATAMTTLNLGTGFDTGNVTDMSNMFEYCGYTAMTSLNLGDKFNTSKVIDMQYMFKECGHDNMTTLTLGANFDTSQVKSMRYMFQGCGYTKLASIDLGSKFDTSQVTDMSYMFSYFGYTKLTSLTLGEKFYTTNVTDMSYMFNYCGYTLMTSLDLGPAFTNIGDTYTDFVTNCGKSGATIYAPESIYKNRTNFKLNTSSTTTITYSRGIINPKYRPVWTKVSATVDTDAKTLRITVKGSTSENGYTSNVTGNLPTGTLTGTDKDLVKVYIDGGEATSLTKTVVLKSSSTTGSDVQYEIVLSDFEETSFQSGKSFKEWSGNITLKFASGTVSDSYGNKNMESIDNSSGEWIDQVIEDATKVNKNTDGSMFADFIAPSIIYRYSSSDIDYTGKTVKVVFSVTDKYYSSSSSTLSVSDLTIEVDGEEPDWNKVTRTLTSSNITATVDGASRVVGKEYTLTLSGLEQSEIASGDLYLDYSGVVTVAIPAGKAVDESGNSNVAKTITMGIDLPEETGSSVVADVVDPIWREVETTLDIANTTATIKIQGTDKYFASSTLTSDNIETLVDGTAVTGSSKTVVGPTELKDSNGNQYGVEYTITISRFSTTANQLKVRIPAGTLTDESGNTSEAETFMIYNCLKATNTESESTSGFLGNTSVQRQNVENVTFVSSLNTMNSAVAWDVSAQQDGSIMAWYANGDTAPYKVYIGSDYEIFANKDASYLFSYIGYADTCTATETITNLDFLTTGFVTNMTYMFKYCGYQKMATLSLPDTFSTKNVTNMWGIFYGTGYMKMTSMDLGNSFDTSNVTDMTFMFNECGFTKMETLNLGDNFDTSNVTGMRAMFRQCGYTAMTTLDLKNKFNTSKVTNMWDMFNECGHESMTTLTLGDKFDTSNVDIMTYMFYGCGYKSMTTLNLGDKFDTSKVTIMKRMFGNCGYTAMTSLDLGDKFYTSNVTDMDDMFNGCGQTAMTTLDLGPVFTKIASTNTNFMTNCGKSGAVIYAPESIYKNRTSFKLSSTDTTTESGAIAVSSGRTINPIYKPEWTKVSSSLDTTNKTLSIVVKGNAVQSQKVNGVTINYSSNVTSALTASNITVYVDGEEATSITKAVSSASPSATSSEVTHTITLSNLEETVRQSGKKFKEWSGNIAIRIGGRGEATSTYTANVLKDTYGNQSMMSTDESGSWVDVTFKDGNIVSNTNGTMFADFIAPEFTYKYSNTIIDHDTETVTVVFDITDKYFNSSLLSTDSTANNITIKFDDITATNATKALTKLSDLTLTIKGTETKVGERYQLVVTNLDQGGGDYYSGIMTLAFPAGVATDKSNNGSLAKTITIGVDEPENTTTAPYLPTGYTQVSGTSLENGLTIQDSLGNQYVWVEVPKTEEVYPTAGLAITEFTDEEYTAIENDLHTYTSVYRNGTSYTDTYCSDAQTGLTSTQYTELKQKMLKSVYKYGGFYVGKYEAGIEDAPKTDGSADTAPTETAVIKQNAYPYNYVTCSQAQTLASGFASELDGYTSSLMFGVQWDLVLKYMETKGASQSDLNSDSKSWGNYYDNLCNITNASSKYSTDYGSTWTSGAYGEKNKSVLLSTGASDTFSKQGIYDLAGNVCEWTLEYTSNTRYPCAFRGGKYNNYGRFDPASYRDNSSTTFYNNKFGFRPSLYKDVDLDPDSDAPGTGSDPVIVDVVDPVWKVENINIDKTNKKVTADLIATDKYLTGTSNSTLTTSNITVSVDGDTSANTAITKTLSASTFSTNATTGLKEIKYTLTLTNWEQASKQTGKSFLEYSGTTKITIAAGTITDDYTNASNQQEFTLGHVDFIKPRIEKVSSTKNASGKTETIVFNVIDKYLDTTDAVADTEITAYVDGETANLTKTLTRVTANDVSATINGTSRVVSQQYQLVLSGFEQSANNAKGYKDWSGTVSISVAASAVKDQVSGGTTNTNDVTTLTGDYVDFINPYILYETSTSDIDRDGKSYQMVFTVTDKYYTSGELTVDDLTITLADGKNTYNLKNEDVEITFAKKENITATNVKMTNASTGAVETVATTTIGHRYVLTLSNLEELEIKTGNTTLDYSGIITLDIAQDKILDRTGNKNVAKTITSQASLSDGSTTSVVDVVQPIWRRTTGGTVDLTAKTASIVVQGTDTYYASNSLTASKIKVYGYTGATQTDITSTVNPQLSTATALNESVTVSGTTSTRQYGVQYTISLTNFPIDKNKIKVVIPAETLTDQSGNKSEAYEMILYTTLESAASETEATSGFLGNTSIQRQNIESVTFVNSTSGANSTKWDVSAVGDNSIIAWYTGSGPYQVYIGSDEFMCANQDSSYLFSYIGYASTCTATSVINGLDVLNTTTATNMSYMFQYCGYKAMTSLELGSNFNTANVTNMSYMFQYCGYTAMITFNLGTNFNTAKVTNMNSMFQSCGYTAMTALSLGSNFDTASVTNMYRIFRDCGYKAMTSLDLGSNFNTAAVTNMSAMFVRTGYTKLISLNLGSQFDTSNATTMEYMFTDCGRLAMTTLTLGDKFNTAKVTNMNQMFYNCGYASLTSLDLGDLFNTAAVTNMTNMFNGCGYTAMTALDLGPAFTKVASTYTNFMTNCGKSGAVIYAPESIYKNQTSFKLSSTDTSTASGTIAVSTGRTINPIYKPEWTKVSSSISTTNKTLSVVVKGNAVQSQTVNGVNINYSSNVTSALTASNITVYVDGEVASSITKAVSTASPSATSSEVTHTITLSGLEETLRQSGKEFKEWSGNIAIRIGGRGEATSTYTANVLKDSYGNQSMMSTDESGSWVDVTFKDGNITSNTNGTMFADFIAPEFTYEYSNTTIDHETETVTVVFDITDKYFNTSTLTESNITVTAGGVTATNATKALSKKTIASDQTVGGITYKSNGDIYYTVNGTSAKVGERYELVITNLDQEDAYKYSGVMTLAISAGVAKDKSNNSSLSKTITIGIDDPTTGDGHDSEQIVDVVDPVWEVGQPDTDDEAKSSSITITAKDKYFKQTTITEDKIKVYVNGVLSSSVVKTLSTPTDVTDTVDGVENTVVGKEYTLTLSNLEPSTGGAEYTEFTPIDPIVGGTAKYRNENGGSVTIEIEAGTIEDQYGNFSNVKTEDVGTIDATVPEVYEVQKTKDTVAKTETIIFNITDKNYDSTEQVEKGDITVFVDGEQVDGINKSSLTSTEIKTTIDGEETIVGHQYTLVLNGFESATKNANGYNDWSGTVSIHIAESASKDTHGNTINPATTTISDFVDFLQPVIEKVSSTRNDSAKTETIVFTAIDKYINTSDLITEDEIKVYLDGVETTTVDKAITSTEITKTFNKTVDGTVTSGDYVIGHEYTLVLSGFEETDTEFTESGRDYREWSGNVSIEVIAGAVRDNGPYGTDINGTATDSTKANKNELTPIEGDFVDFIKPRIEKVSSTKDATGKTETIIFNVIDKYLDTSDEVIASEITTYVDGETANLTKALTRVSANDVSATINGTSQVVSQQYQLVLSGFEQATNNDKGYKDWSGTVSIEFAEGAVKDKGTAGDGTNQNTNDVTTLIGDYVDYVNPYIVYETSTSDIDRDDVDIDGDGKSYQMVFTVTDKYYTSGELSISDLTITLNDGKNTYNLKNESGVTIGFAKTENITATNVKMTNGSTGAVETVATTTIGHRYVLTISNLEELEIKTGNTTLDYSGVITVAVAKDKISDRAGNKNVDKTITSIATTTDGSTTSVVDVVQPIWRRTTGGSIDLTTQTANIVINGTDTYYASNSLDVDDITILAYEGTTEINITSSVTKTLSAESALNESVTVDGETSTRQYGVKYTLTLEGIPIDKDQVKVIIPAETLTDQSGNKSEAYEMKLYTTLMSAEDEKTEASAFLGNSSLQRQNIESITFLDTTADAASNKWDVSAARDDSIWAWYEVSTGGTEENGPYQVYIGSDEFMCANKDSSYLFSYIGYASSCTATSVINGLLALNTTTATNMSYMFQYCGYTAMTSLDLGDNFDTRNVTNMSSMFLNCGYKKMTSLDLSFSKFNTSLVTNMSYMFDYCGYSEMASLNLGTNFNTSSVEYMENMFRCCGYTKMTSLDLSSATFNTSNVKKMNGMFASCGSMLMTSLNLGDKFNTSKVTDMSYMFNDCGNKEMTTLDLGDLFYTNIVIDMTSMFKECGQVKMTTLDLGPAFTKIAATHDDFMTNCGTSSLVVYAPESIYSDRTTFKLNKLGQ